MYVPSFVENLSSNQLFSNFSNKNVAITKFLSKRVNSSCNFHTALWIYNFFVKSLFNQSFSNTAFLWLFCFIFTEIFLRTFRTITPQISSTFIYILVLTLKLVCNFRTLPHRHLLPHSTLLYVLQKL